MRKKDETMLVASYSFNICPIIDTLDGEFRVRFIEIYSDKIVKCVGIYDETSREGAIFIKSPLQLRTMIDRPETIFLADYYIDSYE